NIEIPKVENATMRSCIRKGIAIFPEGDVPTYTSLLNVSILLYSICVNISTSMGLKEAEHIYCPPPENTTCCLVKDSLAVSIVLYIVFMTGIASATFGNLMVIISIAHFKQLHTPTNVLTLSMAAADFLIGIFVMPVTLIQAMDKCWDLGVNTCMAVKFCYMTLTTISFVHLILLSVDRYYAVCYPLHYSTKITVGRACVFAAIGWICSICYSTLFYCVEFNILYGDICVGICYYVLDVLLYIVDVLFTSLFPFSIMLILYSKILIVAIQHAKALRETRHKAHTVQNKNKVKVLTERQNKATITVGIVIGTFYISECLLVFKIMSKAAFSIPKYLVLFNFALNPLIYGLFYPWFRKGFRFIITCKIFKPDSSLINFMPNWNDKDRSELLRKKRWRGQQNFIPRCLSFLHCKKQYEPTCTQVMVAEDM
uniref:G-protein coupled receptors family 1 profile domain-containing protein n=1 Tax=Erpetoichthys calabaricus TaxID=27687 RepID=A0A8C4RGM2_ERPCA